MKQKNDPYIILPKKLPKTIIGLNKWHRDIMELTLFLEFKQRALRMALKAVNSEIKEYSPYATKPPLESAARMALRQLNKLKNEIAKELKSVKHGIKIVHDTNEAIVGSIIKSSIGEENMHAFDPENVDPRTNLLHGTKGWMTEVATADWLINEGYCAFVTFGSIFDPRGIDVVAFSKPRARVQFRLHFKNRRRRRNPKRSSN